MNKLFASEWATVVVIKVTVVSDMKIVGVFQQSRDVKNKLESYAESSLKTLMRFKCLYLLLEVENI